MLKIENYRKIRGLAYYEDGTWEQLQPTYLKSGAKAHIDYVMEDKDWYWLRLIYIQPQPQSAKITIWRKENTIVDRTMYRIEMERGGETVMSEYWEAGQFEMDKVLEEIKNNLIDK